MAGIKYTYTKSADATEENPYKIVKAYKADGTEIDRKRPTRRLSTTSCMVAEMASQSSVIQN